MDNLKELQVKLEEIEKNRGDDDYPGQSDEYRRQIVIEAAVHAADEMIMEGSDGTEEDTDYLTSMVAMKLHEKAHYAISKRLLRSRLGLDKIPGMEPK